MTTYTSDIAFTESVKSQQERLGSRRSYEKMERGRGWAHAITEDLAGFVAQRDSIYLGTATADGQPYVQHRGGPPGFIKVIDDHTLAFADYSGNRQYISIGNLTENDRAFLFLMDYDHQRRVKIWGRARFVEDDRALLERLQDADYQGIPERAFVFTVEAWDINCPKHIPRLIHAEQAEAKVTALESRNAELERANEQLRAKLRGGSL